MYYFLIVCYDLSSTRMKSIDLEPEEYAWIAYSLDACEIKKLIKKESKKKRNENGA